MSIAELKRKVLLLCLPEDAKVILAEDPSDSLFSALYGDQIGINFYNHACEVVKMSLPRLADLRDSPFQPLASLQQHVLTTYFKLAWDMNRPEVQQFLKDINWRPRPDRVSGNVKQREQDRLEATLNLIENILELLAKDETSLSEAKIKAAYRAWLAFEGKQKASTPSVMRMLTP
jgi:hypothetical protein